MRVGLADRERVGEVVVRRRRPPALRARAPRVRVQPVRVRLVRVAPRCRQPVLLQPVAAR
jgi:hypothetical protein